MKAPKKSSLFIIGLIAVVNAIGYGIIIPVLYVYSMKFGLSDAQNGLLFATYSLCQFISTPVIGRLSDKFGRRPLLISSIIGTAISFFMMAFAPNAIFLFFARALDGITAGNITVASAVVADTTEGKDRARGFGIIGASFGFGFIAGPAITALTSGISLSLPFIVAGVISAVAAILTYYLLPETNRTIGKVKNEPLFNLTQLFSVLVNKTIAPILIITLLHFTALSLFIFAYQPFTVKVLHLSPVEVSMVFTLFGIMSVISQLLILPRVSKLLRAEQLLRALFFILILAFVGFAQTHTLGLFIVFSILLSLTNNLVNPLLQTILSLETDAASQGSMQGISASYMSIGQIIGPILGGVIAQQSINAPFLAGAGFVAVCGILSLLIPATIKKRESAF
jgi:MFS family permease